jgi:hypothetical protein
MGQSRRASLVEAVVNVAVGFALSLGLQVALSHFFGWNTSLATDVYIVLLFTCLSLARSYMLRRLFNRMAV